MKKHKRIKKATRNMAATTTSKDWGFGPVSGKGGKTRNGDIGEGMIHREMKEAVREWKQ